MTPLDCHSTETDRVYPPFALLLYMGIFKMVKKQVVFIPTDRKAGDPSQAGDQTDSKLKDSKERWVFYTTDRLKQTVQYLCTQSPGCSLSEPLQTSFCPPCTPSFSFNYLHIIGFIQLLH